MRAWYSLHKGCRKRSTEKLLVVVGGVLVVVGFVGGVLVVVGGVSKIFGRS